MMSFLKLFSFKFPIPKIDPAAPAGMLSKILNFELGPWFWVVAGLLGLLLVLLIVFLIKKIFFSK